VSRERLAALLWGDSGEEQARASVRQALYELRHLSNGVASLLTVTREHVAANAGAVTLDIDRAESLAQAADIAALADLLQGQQTVLFADLDDITPEFDDWLRLERTRRIDRLVALSVQAGQAALVPNDVEPVRALATTLEALDPLSEPVVRLGIQADALSGDPAQAHRRYKRFEERLARELATKPSAETRALLPRHAAAPRAADSNLQIESQDTADVAADAPQPVRGKSKLVITGVIAAAAIVALAFAWLRFHDAPPGMRSAAQARYEQAQTLMRDRRENDLTRARTLLLEAVDVDPEYAEAWASLSIVTMLLSDEPETYGPIPQAQARNQALHYANVAMKLDPNLATAHAALGLVSVRDERAIAHYQRAIALDPQQSEYHRWLGQAYGNTGRSREALDEFKKAAELQPRWPSAATMLIAQLALLGRENEIEAVVRRFEAASSVPYDRNVVRLSAYEKRGELPRMVALGREMLRETSDDQSIVTLIASTFAALGDRQSALAVLQPEDVLLRAIINRDLQQVERVARDSPSLFWHQELAMTRAGELLVANGQDKLLLQLLDARYTDLARIREDLYDFIPPAPALIVALREAGRTTEADELIRIALERIEADIADGVSSITWAFEHAQLLALAGDNAAALTQLEQLLQKRWPDLLVSPFVPVTDFVAFRALKSDPRMIALQQQLNARIQAAREQIGPI
jgi:DNA-binding SARP family transcriptional activator